MGEPLDPDPNDLNKIKRETVLCHKITIDDNKNVHNSVNNTDLLVSLVNLKNSNFQAS